MSIDPYKTLGLDKDCTSEQIKHAYKTKAKRHHPDIGGNPKEFALVKISYDTLKDKKKRQEFDDYGVISDSAVVNEDELAANKLRQVFITALQKIPSDDLKYTDIINVMKQLILQQRVTLEASLEKIEENKKTVAKTLKILEKRLKRKGDQPNFLLDLIKYEMSGNAQQIHQINKDQDVCMKMIHMLDEFSYKPDDKPDEVPHMHNYFHYQY